MQHANNYNQAFGVSPLPRQQLEYGQRYHIWIGNDYVGVAVWTRDYEDLYYESYFDSADLSRPFRIYRADRWQPANDGY